MRVGLNTYGYMYRETALELIPRLATKAAVRRFEILVTQGHCWPATADQRKELAAVIAGEGVEVSALNLRATDQNLVSDYPEAQALALSHYKMMIDAAAAASIPYIVVVPGRTSPVLSPPAPVLRNRFAKAIVELNSRACDEGVGLLLENVPYGFLSDTASLVSMVKELDQSNINIVLDVANAGFIGEDFRVIYAEAADFVRMIHLSNTTTNRLGHNLFNAGILPMNDILRFVKESGRMNYVNVEVVGDDDEIIADFKTAEAAIVDAA